jgi:hypothetical protein
MTLLVEAPPGYEPERRYILEVVLSDWLGLDWRLRSADRGDVRIALAEEPDGRCVVLPDVLFATPREDWLTPRSLPSVRVAEGLPVLYGSAQAEVDVFGSAFFMLTRYEELVVADRDRFGRFPAASSIASRAGFLGVPIVDAYVELLWSAFRRAWPGLRRRPRAFEVTVTHDVDDPLATLDHARSAVFRMDVSERHGLRSAFYFLAHRDQRPRDGRYLFEHPWVRSLIGNIGRRGHEVGFHPSFSTYRDAARTHEEFTRLLRVAEGEGVHQEHWGGRQHFLRWANPDTWRNWDAAGLSYDSTLGYSEAVGFRSGTCHPYRVFDLVQRRPLDLHERPFQVMDVALRSSMSLSHDAAHDVVMDIASKCRRYGGSLGILWHNSGLLRTDHEKRWYASLVAALSAP